MAIYSKVSMFFGHEKGRENENITMARLRYGTVVSFLHRSICTLGWLTKQRGE